MNAPSCSNTPVRLGTLSAALVLGGMLSGCALNSWFAVGPSYQTPKTDVPAVFVNAPALAASQAASQAGPQTAAPTAEAPAQFWQAFGDTQLNALVETALNSNRDLRVAQARLKEARAARGLAVGELLPTVDLSASRLRERASLLQAPGTTIDQRTGTSYTAGFDAAWEIDLFGGRRRSLEASNAGLEASEAGLGAAQQSVCAEVARNYFELRGLQQRLKIARDSLSNQLENARITQARFDAGQVTELDTARATTLVESLRATIPALEAQLERARYRLAVLTAQAPGALSSLTAGAPAPLPDLPSVQGIGTPELLLRRRPDIRQAERNLAAATARIGVATADLFPKVSISGLIGVNATRAGDLGDNDSQFFSVGPSITWNVLDFGRTRSRIAQTQAQTEGALATYEQTVLLALEDTENALVTLDRSQQQAIALARATRAAQRAAELARIRYESGATDLLTVLDAERQLLSTQDALVQAQVAAHSGLIAVYKALGGGWLAAHP